MRSYDFAARRRGWIMSDFSIVRTYIEAENSAYVLNNKLVAYIYIYRYL